MPRKRTKRPTLKKPLKHDNQKNMLQLVPPELIFAAGNGVTHGAKKYAPGNWAKGDGFEWSRLYGGLQRHVNAFWNGEDIDPDSGNHHLDHAACMLGFLIAHVKRGIGKDDRVDIGVARGKADKKRSRNKRK